MPELISPELVLVDPELAARARAALPESGRLPRWSSDSFPGEETPTASEGLAEQQGGHDQPGHGVRPPAKWPRSLRNAVFTFSACLNLLLVLMLASEERSASRAQHIAGGAPNLTQPVARPQPASGGSQLSRPATRASVTQAERSVLASVNWFAPLRKRFVDAATGLPSEQLSARCEPSLEARHDGSGTLRCVISARQDGKSVTSVVTYDPNAHDQGHSGMSLVMCPPSPAGASSSVPRSSSRPSLERRLPGQSQTTRSANPTEGCSRSSAS